MSFEVEKKGSVRKDSGVEFQPYQYKSGSLKIYDPSNNACSLDDPKTWIEASN
ncbi:MAG: hypothetical protein MJ201_01835 [Mycoplasmoidaceae bacterium]|nr:hypothetical protein [Mycoplasmoidaceae bacterium]